MYKFLLYTILVFLSTPLMGQFNGLLSNKVEMGVDRKMMLQEITHNRPFVLIFFDSECPISQKYTKQLDILKNQFPQITFLGIFTKWAAWEDIQNFKNEYPLSYNVCKDNKNRLIKKLRGRVVPEVFFFNEKGILLYRGAVDNWFYALGKHRPEPTECYLEDAILSFLNHQDIEIKKTNAIGCVIEY